MKIDTEIIRTHEGEYVWADDNPSGRGFLHHPVGADVADSWLEQNGLVGAEPEAPAPEPEPKAPVAKKAAQPANKAVKAPEADK